MTLNLYKKKPVFAIAEQWTKDYKPKEIITKGMPGFPLCWDDEFGHRYPMRDQDGWVPTAKIMPGMSWADGEVIKKGYWIVTERGGKVSVHTDKQFRSLYDAATFFERTDQSGEDEAKRDSGKA